MTIQYAGGVNVDDNAPLWMRPDPQYMASLGYGIGRDSVQAGKATLSAPVKGNANIVNTGLPWQPSNVSSLLQGWWNQDVASSYLPGIKDDAFVNSILDQRQNDQLNTLDMAHSRGQLSNQGYEAAKQNLSGDQRDQASSYVNDLLSGYNSENIQKLGDYFQEKSTAAASDPYQFNFLGFRNDLNTKAQELSNTDNYKQAILDSLGSSPLFNINNAWSAATKQGPVNRKAANLAALTEKEKNPVQDYQTSLLNFGV